MILYTESLNQYIASEGGGKIPLNTLCTWRIPENDQLLSGLKEFISLPTGLVNRDSTCLYTERWTWFSNMVYFCGKAVVTENTPFL